MAAKVVGLVSTLRWKSPAGAMNNVDVVVTRQSVFVGSMKRIFRIRGVNRSMVRLDLVAVRGLVVFLEVSHGGLKLSHERLQRPEVRLNLGKASRLGNIWDMTFQRSTHIFRRRWAFADPFSQSGLSIAAIVAPLIARLTRFAIGDSSESSLGLHALRDRNVRVDRKRRETICGQRASQISRFFRRRTAWMG